MCFAFDARPPDLPADLVHPRMAGGVGRLGQRGGEHRAVGGRELELLGARAARHARVDEVGGQVRRMGVKREAHGGSPR